VRGSTDHFAEFKTEATIRTPGQILATSGPPDWALALADGRHDWHDSTPLPWPEEVSRFFQALERLDARLAREAPLGTGERQLFQGPIADALTHVGQIAMLRRMFGSPVRGENYLKADIAPAAWDRSSPLPAASSSRPGRRAPSGPRQGVAVGAPGLVLAVVEAARPLEVDHRLRPEVDDQGAAAAARGVAAAVVHRPPVVERARAGGSGTATPRLAPSHSSAPPPRPADRCGRIGSR